MGTRMAMVIELKPETVAEYKRLHADVWPQVLDRLKRSNIAQYSIFLRQPENLLFGYWVYEGDNYDDDMAAIATDPVIQDWWKVCGPMQKPLETRTQTEWWASMEEIFYCA